MSNSPFSLPPAFRPARALLALAFYLFFLTPPSGAAANPRRVFKDSIASIPPEISSSAREPQANELAEPLEFEITLQIRNFDRMEERIARGETISPREMSEVYLPREDDYNAILQWLVAEGFTITQTDPSHLSVFALGTVSKIQQSLQVKMMHVTVSGTGYPAAQTAPSLPAEISAPVLGVNGLQPFRRHHRHQIVQPLASGTITAPFKVGEILTAYNGLNLGVSGSGEAIAILIDTAPPESDLETFWTNNNIAQSWSNITVVNVNNVVPLPTTSDEDSLDTEWTSSIAPNAMIRVYATGSLSDSKLDKGFQQIIADVQSGMPIHQLSISLGLGELDSSKTQIATDDQYLATLAASGVSVFVSTGDDGSTPDSTGINQGQLQISNYADDPNVTAVGGTTLSVSSTTGAYISEKAWKGSGGGSSVIFTRPSWQTGAGVPAGTMRLNPDVASVADPNTGAYIIVSGNVVQVGGTSWSAPTWAGFSALINEARSSAGRSPLGLLNPVLYPLVSSSNFRDITTGSNATNASGGLYTATTGYDETTGLGTPNLAVLVPTLAAINTAPPIITNFTPSNGIANTTVTLNGLYFLSVSSVTISGTAVSYTVNSPTQIALSIPQGISTGPITVTTPGGTATSGDNFVVLEPGAIVISQIYGGGGNTTGVLNNDFIELFNPGSTPVDLTMCTMQYATRTGTTWQSTLLSGTVQPNHYYLIKEINGGKSEPALPTADASGSIDISSTSGKVALVSGTYPITAGTACPVSGTTAIFDFVGYGNTSCFLGSPAPLLSSPNADIRGDAGFTNTGTNSFDFTAGTPNPHNSAYGPVLSVSKSHIGTFEQGDIGDVYTLLVTNAGALATTGTVTLRDAIPTGMTVTGMSGSGWTVNLNDLAATRSDVLASGSSYPPVTVTVNVSSSAAASLTNIAIVSGGGTISNGTANDVTTVITPIQSWRQQYFGSTANTGTAADTANPSGDGISNLLKYAIGLNPLTADANPIVVDTSTGRLRLTAPKNPQATDVVFAVEVTGTLTNAASWSTNGTTVDQNTTTLLEAHDNTLLSSGTARFIHLRVTTPNE